MSASIAAPASIRALSTPSARRPGAPASGHVARSAGSYAPGGPGQSEDIENSLTAQGTSDRETTREVTRDELVEEAERARKRRAGEI